MNSDCVQSGLLYLCQRLLVPAAQHTSVSSCLALMMTSLVVLTKLSLLWLLRLYKYEQIHPATWYAIVLILLATPHVTQLLYIIWNTPILSSANREELPRMWNAILGILSSVLEGAAAVAFVIEVTPVLPEPVLLMLPYTILSISVIIDVFNNKDMSKNKPDRKFSMCNWTMIKLTLGAYLLLTPSLIGVFLYMGFHFRMNLPELFVLAVTLFTLSGIWTSDNQNAVVRSRSSHKKCQTIQLVYTPIKITSTFVSTFLCLYFKMASFRADMSEFIQRASTELLDMRIWIPIAICLTAGFLTLLISMTSSKLGLVTAGIKLPFFLSPCLILLCTVAIWHDFSTDAFWELSGDDLFSWTTIAMSTFTWVIPFLFPGLQLLKSSTTKSKSFCQSFLSFSWNVFFLEPRTILNYQPNDPINDDDEYENSSSFYKVSSESNYETKLNEYYIDKSKKSDMNANTLRLFLCTTMYKESESEMARYITSITDVFNEMKDDKVFLEAHVLFDGAVEPTGSINVQGRQLLYLLCSRFGCEFSELTKRTTPYGCQVNTGKLLSHIIYIHFKDSLQVKNKKRWSQVMYLNYVLQFRCGHDIFDDKRIWSETKINFSPFSNDTMPVSVIDRPSIHNNLGEQNEKETRVYSNYNSNDCCHDDIMYNRQNIQEMKINRRFCSNLEESMFRLQAEYTRKKRGTSGANSDFYSDASHSTDSSSQKREKLNHNAISVDSLFSESDNMDQTELSGDNRSHDATIASICFNDIDVLGEIFQNEYFAADCSCYEERNNQTDNNKVLCRKTNSQSLPAASLETQSVPKHRLNHITKTSIASNGLKSSQRQQKSSVNLHDVFILASDADTAFNAKSVKEVLTKCHEDSSLGAICGRTDPIGSAKPIVWYQKFEYAKDFWLVKASQNVIGSVTCCPGCFSLYRGSALAQVYQDFSKPTMSAFDSLVKDHGEDRWLCTLMMQRGWRLAYNAHAYNSTHCPETVGEFLRQRRRWVLSELSNTLSIFMTISELIRHNSSFSGMFLVSLLMTFLWILLSPATTLVFLCAGGDVLLSVPLTATLPFAAASLLVYSAVCCFMSQSRQKVASLLMTVTIATAVLILAIGFVIYVVKAIQEDMFLLGVVRFRPYFLVFLLVLATIYAAVLHPREGLSLVYGLCYGILFPAIFVVLPVYSLANMVDQSWGTREAGSKRCCERGQEEEDEKVYDEFCISTSTLISLNQDQESVEESYFWQQLNDHLIGNDVNIGEPAHVLSHDLEKLRRNSVLLFLLANTIWFAGLSVVYVYAGSDVILCYVVGSIFSFSLVLQLVGLTCYRFKSLVERYLRAHDVSKLNSNFNIS